ncbi:hypothetical protein H310_13487 [Aphanomyces invadans]|uniref:TFIIS N-terminal domain-containing protein n=1 Tax=Aphanomyces invadans TaxID=157072 RepID=A0A024TE18_9STRA|nr:hypothetical protein H310_13487 [Aphanomyces invadans]ETV92264.1 hypothetical protein H310_13487 [Aphanomyces invadans]|eukprot:XP_008879228.1 hypothetical protein H310_13487 [Aphanomyces invadans]
MVEGASVDVSHISQRLHSAIQENDWQTNKQAAKDLSGLLAVLTTYTPDPITMRETRIGVAVNKLRKHSDECVKAYASRLTEKWKAALDVKSSSSSKAKPAVVTAASYTKIPETTNDAQKGDAARLRVQQAYASERAKKDSRTSIFLDQPIVKKVRGRKVVPSTTTITRFTNPERANMTHKVPRAVAPSSHSSSATTASASRARPPSTSDVGVPARRPAMKSSQSAASNANTMTPDELRHHQRQMKLRALAEQKARATGKTVPFASTLDTPSAVASTKSAPVPSKFTAINRQKPSGTYVDKRKMNSSSSATSASSKLTPEEQSRKELLNRMYPRAVGRPDPNTNLKQKRKRDEEHASSTAAPLQPGEREVMHWLKGLAEGDMSQYAQAFFDNGFDTMKLLSTVTDKDLAAMIPKRGHCRVVEAALQSLTRRRKPPERVRKNSMRRSVYDEEEYDTDDSFVDNDNDEGYRMGPITAMMMKKRGKDYRKFSSAYDDDGDSSDMEASFDEIQREEDRSAKYGDYEDEVEDRRNRIHKAKKQKRK